MVMTSSSMAELRRKMGVDKFPITQLRPNLVVRTDSGEPFQEDEWLGVMRFGGEVTVSWAKFCDRCSSTLIDPATGRLTPRGEPLRTLRTFRQMKHMNRGEDGAALQRKIGDRPIMGNNYVLETGGEVKVGDEVYVGEYV